MLVGEDVLAMIFDFLPVFDVFHSLTLVCHRFGKLLLREPQFLSQFACRLVGLTKVPVSYLKLVHRELMQTVLKDEKLLLFEGVPSPCYLNQARYQVENMFDYSPSVHITHTQVGNITTRAYFVGTYDDRQKFKEDTHEDILWFSQFEAPSKYRSARLLDDNFLTVKPVRRVADVYRSNEFSTKAELWSLMPTNEGRAATPATPKSAILNRLGIGRPVFTSHPVRTLLVSTKTVGSDPLPLKPFHGLDSLEKVKKCESAKIGSIQCYADYSIVEFEGTDGPLLWVQFSDYLLLQLEIVLKVRRRATHLEVLLIDSEDRKAEFGGAEKGIAISYVVAAGWVVET